MIPTSLILGIIASLCLIPSLYHGAQQDRKEYRFSRSHFETLWVNLATVLTITMYISLVVEGSWPTAATFIAISVIAWVACSFMGFRYGSGGDWRALIYIALISPFILIQTLIAASVCGFVQAIYWLTRGDIEIPPMYRKIPFAVSILYGYVIALGWLVVSNMGDMI